MFKYVGSIDTLSAFRYISIAYVSFLSITILTPIAPIIYKCFVDMFCAENKICVMILCAMKIGHEKTLYCDLLYKLAGLEDRNR